MAPGRFVPAHEPDVALRRGPIGTCSSTGGFELPAEMTESPIQRGCDAFSSRDESFPKSRRLCKRREYLTVQNGEIKAHSGGFVGLVFFRESTGPGRLGVTASKRLGKAVVRNAVKRLIREAFRTGRLRLPDGVDVVVIAKRRAVGMSSSEVFADLETLGRRIKRLVELNK